MVFNPHINPHLSDKGLCTIKSVLYGPGGQWVYYLEDQEGRYISNNYYFEYQLQKATPAQVILYGK